jgi:hypothetical protein
MWRRIGYVVLLTLLNGISAQWLTAANRFTNVDDVTQDHANPRAVRTIATSVFRGTAFHLATTEAPVFLRRDLRQRADYFAVIWPPENGHHGICYGDFVEDVL